MTVKRRGFGGFTTSPLHELNDEAELILLTESYEVLVDLTFLSTSVGGGLFVLFMIESSFDKDIKGARFGFSNAFVDC